MELKDSQEVITKLELFIVKAEEAIEDLSADIEGLRSELAAEVEANRQLKDELDARSRNHNTESMPISPRNFVNVSSTSNSPNSHKSLYMLECLRKEESMLKQLTLCRAEIKALRG